MPQSDQQLIEAAYKYGYFFHPDTPNGHNVDQAALALLTTADQVVKDAIRSWQQADSNISPLSLHFHGRPPIEDGDVGPATRALSILPRCPIPDYPLPGGVSPATGDLNLDKVLQSQQNAAAMGSGSWPSCNPSQPGVNSIRISINNTAAAPSNVKGYLQQCLKAVQDAYAEVGLAIQYILDDPGADVEIKKKFESLSGSVIGWNEFPQPNTCNQTIDGRLDTGYGPSDYRYWAGLECHETGHGVGLQHGRGSIMNPSILLVWPLTYVGTYSYANLKRWFGGVPINTPPTPTDPPPTSEEYWFKPTNAGLELFRGQQSTGNKYLLTKNPLQ